MCILRVTMTVCEGWVVCWKPLLITSAGRGREDPVVCYDMWLFTCRTAKGSNKQETTLQHGLGGAPLTPTQTSWWGRDYILTQACDRWARPIFQK